MNIPRPLLARPRHRSPALLTLLAPVMMGLPACRAAVDAYASDQAAAHQAASQAVTSVQFRFDSPLRDDRYDAARMRIARYALAPSKVENDTIWTNRVGSRRELTAFGRIVEGRYFFSARAHVPMPAHVGESRHYVALDTLAGGDRLWRTQVDQAIGSVTPQAAVNVFTALFHSAERSPADIRADYRRTMPRATASFGRLSALDTIRTTRLDDGSTLVTLGLQLHPDRIAGELPDFSKYLKKYISPARYTFTLRDPAIVGVHANDIWFVVEGDDDRVMLRFRSRHGLLQPLDGPARAMPDTLALMVDASAKFGLFTVGVEQMRGRFVFVNTPDEVGWDMRFSAPPRWDLPPIAGRLVRGSLNRPFRGDGVSARLTVRKLSNGQSVIHRRTDVAVSESAIMRWLGNLGFTAMDDFAGRVELEEARFLSQAMRAMRQDISSLQPVGQ